LECLVAVELRHRHVENDECRCAREQITKSRAAVLRFVDRVAGALEELAHEQPDVLVVVDYEDTGPGVHTGLIPSPKLNPCGDARSWPRGTRPPLRTP